MCPIHFRIQETPPFALGTPNLYTFAPLYKSCAALHVPSTGIVLHGYLVKCGFVANTSLMMMYRNFGWRLEAFKVFEELPERDTIACNSLIRCCGENGVCGVVTRGFNEMVKTGFSPSLDSVLYAIKARGEVMIVQNVVFVYEFVKENGFYADVHISTWVPLDMYSKCGNVEFARVIFEEEFLKRSLVSWNSRNWGTHEMDLQVICAFHAIVIKQGLRLDSDIVLGTTIVDTYGKCSDIKAALFLFRSVKTPSAVLWNAMISGYNLNNQAHQTMTLL
ncbi:hypothetical protein GIB67_006605 [Kingdonia uniflora]|uniref:Pentatricopeptide repeat-containing protein n=1 Tax=Kingdonia uniflora TaxID=39325 RepID=A0A7J7LF36_9MAGN|nr:hypothetical protein GIB67_006605 [Kingdonia uniflora]